MFIKVWPITVIYNDKTEVRRCSHTSQTCYKIKPLGELCACKLDYFALKKNRYRKCVTYSLLGRHTKFTVFLIQLSSLFFIYLLFFYLSIFFRIDYFPCHDLTYPPSWILLSRAYYSCTLFVDEFFEADWTILTVSCIVNLDVTVKAKNQIQGRCVANHCRCPRVWWLAFLMLGYTNKLFVSGLFRNFVSARAASWLNSTDIRTVRSVMKKHYVHI